MKSINAMNNRIVITTSMELYSFAPESIAFVQSDGNYSIVTLIDRSDVTFTMNLQQFSDLLVKQLQIEAQRFVRIGRSLIVNRELIHRVNPSKQILVLAYPAQGTRFNLTASKEALRQLKQLIESEL